MDKGIPVFAPIPKGPLTLSCCVISDPGHLECKEQGRFKPAERPPILTNQEGRNPWHRAPNGNAATTNCPRKPATTQQMACQYSAQAGRDPGDPWCLQKTWVFCSPGLASVAEVHVPTAHLEVPLRTFPEHQLWLHNGQEVCSAKGQVTICQ